MTNNDILRRLRYTFDLGDDRMIQLFTLGEYEVTRAEVSDWLKKDEDEAFVEISDEKLAIFLNGLISDKRGKKEGASPAPEKRLNHNMVLRKIKIALQLQDQDILDILSLDDFPISKHELSAFFRNPDHKHYRILNGQMFRHFMNGLQKKVKGEG
jgi:uncharacterized protein YehS (DUF1456 family)